MSLKDPLGISKNWARILTTLGIALNAVYASCVLVETDSGFSFIL